MKFKEVVLMIICTFLLGACGLIDNIKNNQEESKATPPYEIKHRLHYVERVTYDCSYAPVSSDQVIYTCDESLETLASFKNIPIERGEFTNLTNGSFMSNHESVENRKENKEKVYVSNCGRAQTLKLERGVNQIRYQYLTCAIRDSHGQCIKWDIQEEGMRNLTIKVQGVLNRMCKIYPVCKEGRVLSYRDCDGWVDHAQPKVLWTEY